MNKGWITCLVLATSLLARAASADESQLSRARALCREHNDAAHRVGLLEMMRCADTDFQAAARDVQTLGVADALNMDAVRELAWWRMIPAGSPQALKDVVPAPPAGSLWANTHKLYLACVSHDRAAMLAIADSVVAPTSFPSAGGEAAHLTLLKELGQSPSAAAMEVLSHRSFTALHALRELDQGLTREADFLRQSKQDDDAKKLEDCRNRLRQGYLAASKHVVESVFALNLSGRTKEADELLAKAKSLAYLNDRAALAVALDRLDPEKAYAHLLAPLLASESAVVNAPPNLDAMRVLDIGQMTVQADRKTVTGGVAAYEGNVRAALGPVSIACGRLAVVSADDKKASSLAGSGSVRVSGAILGGEISADSFTFSPAAGSFTFSGDVRASAGGNVIKAESLTINAAGEVRDPHTLLDDFTQSRTVQQKLDLLPRILKVYAEKDLPEPVRYLLALSLLRPHLAWHELYPPTPQHALRDQVKRLERLREELDMRWAEAHGGEEWMADGMPKQEAPVKVQPGAEQLKRLDKPAGPWFWTLKDRDHADVKHAIELLRTVSTAEARHWLLDLGRNNTVVTFDIVGGYQKAKDAQLVMDTRSADKVTFKLYRVRKPEVLSAVAERIGDDFMYRDYGLDELSKQMEVNRALRARQLRDISHRAKLARKPVELSSDDLVQSWESAVVDLKALDMQRHMLRQIDDLDDEDEQFTNGPDADYFDDACEEYADRIHKRYGGDNWDRFDKPSSWQANRIVTIPAKALAEPGAYILAAEANGQTAYAPILVDPLTLTLRRCRDGVFALVASTDGGQPAAGAEILSRGQINQAIADAQGAAFARVFAAGDRAIVAHKDGRYAIGGFGRLFEGLYVSVWELDEQRWNQRMIRDRAIHEMEQAGHVYADRWVVAAYTDRPTYRPGQQVNFKLIARKLKAQEPPAAAPTTRAGFRDEDFDLSSQLELPPEGTPLTCEVIGPRGAVLGSVDLKLNDFGTAAGDVILNAEAAVGTYSLRVRVDREDRLVPGVFAVRYYRRPNFELKMEGAPEKLKPSQTISLRLSGQYYFGKPVAGAKVDARLVRADEWKPLAQAEGALDNTGAVALELPAPASLPPGSYYVIASLADDSGRSVSRSIALQVDDPTPQAPQAGTIASLPRFASADQVIEVRTSAGEVSAEHVRDNGLSRHTFKAEDGRASVGLKEPGWYTLSDGKESTTIYIYGGNDEPEAWPADHKARDAEAETYEPHWVNLSDYDAEDDGERWPRKFDHDHHVLALFDKQHVKVGEKLRVLVYGCGGGRPLFTIEGKTVVDYFLQTEREASSYYIVEIPIKPRYLPNFYLQAYLVPDGTGRKVARDELRKAMELAARKQEADGEDPRWCRIDVLDPNPLPAGGEKLKVQVRPTTQQYRPGEQVDVTVKVTDLAGRPREAEVSLAAVDESVFAFGEDSLGSIARAFVDPHPDRLFYPKSWRSSPGNRWHGDIAQARAMKMADAMAKLQQNAQEAAAADAGKSLDSLALAEPHAIIEGERPVASIPLIPLRSDFRETAAWLPQLRTAADGTATASFKLPDSLTAWRLSAVGLTKDTQIGTGRASLRASKPLAVQVMLPRFAVEKDRLLAVALVHNNTDQPHTCAIAWQVTGALPDADAGAAAKVTVAAKSSARVTLWIQMNRVGEVTVNFRAADGELSDGESRSLTVQPMGVERTITLNGGFEQKTELQLPAGFIARDVQVSISRTDLAQALDGLPQLIDYPYGCVEQTMSRFLPAVIAKRAIQQVPVALPQEALDKLPGAISKGLERLYNFQHADGGWGWWEKDETNLRMTIYVVDGLARCQAAGVKVDPQVLQRGCDFIKKRIAGNTMENTENTCRAWLALGLAGQIDAAQLGTSVRGGAYDGFPAGLRCLVALSCRYAGLPEEAARMWTALRDWQPTDAAGLSLKLTAQLTFGQALADCYTTGSQLMALRSGTCWDNTQTTAWAIGSMAELLKYVHATSARSAFIALGDKTIIDIRDPEKLKLLSHSIHATGPDVPSEPALKIKLAAETDGAAGPAVYAVTAIGTQQLDEVKPSGTTLKITREYLDLDGKPLKRPVRIGQVVAVHLTIDAADKQEFVIAEDRRPAGFEYADDRLTGPAAASAANVEFRDDRVCAFFTNLPAGKHELTYYLRAETPGISHVLPAVTYPMYNDKVRGESGADGMEVGE